MNKKVKEPLNEYLDAVNILVRGLHALVTEDFIIPENVYDWVDKFPEYVEILKKHYKPESELE